MNNNNDSVEAVILSTIDKISALEQEKKEITQEISLQFKILKDKGYNVQAVRRALALKKMDESKRIEYEFSLDKFKEILGISS